jgi:hypothetical protein
MPVETIFEETLNVNTETLLDPFGENNLTTPSHVVEENNIVVTKKVKAAKFTISGELKKRLNKLLSESTNENAKKVAQAILELKKEPESGYNYLGLSNSDYTKISYLDNVRIEKFKDSTTKEMVLDNNSKLYKVWNNWNDQKVTQEVRMYSKNIKKPFAIVNLKDVVDEPVHADFKRILETTREALRNGTITPFIEVNGEKIFSLSAYVAKFNPEVYSEMIEGVNTGVYNARTLYDSRKVSLTAVNYYYDNKKYCQIKENYHSYTRSEYFIKPTLVEKSKLWDSNVRYHTKVGKIVRKIFPNMFNDVEITDFSEEYRKLIVINKVGASYDEVSGEDIATWYLEDNSKSSGQLGNSCMRYYKCQGFFKIYTENDFCKLAILKSRNKVSARALLWTVNNKTYYDRIYHSDNDAMFILENILKSKEYEKIYGTGPELKIPLSKTDFDDYGSYPYLDTFCYYDSVEEVLTNYEPNSECYYSMRNTNGYLHKHISKMCASCDTSIGSDEDDYSTITIGDLSGEIVCNDCGFWTSNDEYILYGERQETYDRLVYHENELIELADGQYARINDPYLKEYENGYGYFIHGYSSVYDHECVIIDNLFYYPGDPELEKLQQEEN